MKRDWKFIGLAGIFLVMLFIAYSNHFTNGFYFDDSHTIVMNTWIRDLKNIPKFFTDYSTMTTDPANQGSMRPVITTLNAIDYAIAKSFGLDFPKNSIVFHIHMFINYLILCALLYFLILFIFDKACKDDWNKYIALICTAWYAHLVGNAETINYIISRSDSFSTLCIVATFVFYIWPLGKRYYLWLIPLIIGFFSKEVVYMTPFVMFFFIALFDEGISLPGMLQPVNFKRTWNTGLKSIPFFIVLIGGLLFIFLFYNKSNSFIGASISQTMEQRMDYFMTQAYCILRYFKNFFIPTDLTADPDIYIVISYTEVKVLFGLLLLIILFITAVFTSMYKIARPIAFGIIWFYVFLAPTSSFNVMYQISNDHRTFLPYIGLIITFGWLATLFVYEMRKRFEDRKKVAIVAFGITFLIIIFNAFGVYQRNIVWSSSEQLWADAVEKSPRNPRALMNYGLSFMARGEYAKAQEYYEKALGFWPNWFSAHINMGIVLDSQDKKEEAEASFAKAIKSGRHSPEPYYYFGRYLYRHGRYEKAKKYLLHGQELSPYHANIKSLLVKLSGMTDVIPKRIEELIKYTEEINTDVAYIELSLALYRMKEYEKAIKAAEKAVELNPNSHLAYNNICASNCALKRWDEAIVACNKALEIAPTFQRARNNLNWAKGELEKLNAK